MHIRSLLCLGACAIVSLTTHGAHAQTATPVWSSGFESGYPGEFLDYPNGWSPSGADIAGRDSSWTIVARDSGEPVFEGDHAYRGRIIAPSSDVNRAYPVIDADIPSPYVNSWMVYLDVDYAALTPSDWISLGTWTNDPNWITLATLSVRDRRIEMAHIDWSYVGPTPQPDFPLRRWVRFTVYIDHTSGGEVAVWQDGVLIIRGTFASSPTDHLLHAHWGLYAEATVPAATMYNDAMQLWTLSSPLSGFDVEPASPFGGYVTPPASDAGTPGGGGGGGTVDAGTPGGGGGGGTVDAGTPGGGGGSTAGDDAGAGGGPANGDDAGVAAPQAGAGGCNLAGGGSWLDGDLPVGSLLLLLAAAWLVRERRRDHVGARR